MKMHTGKLKTSSIPIFLSLLKNALRLNRMMWASNWLLLTAHTVISGVRSIAPLLRGALLGLVINELVNVTKGAEMFPYFNWLVAGLVAAIIIPSSLLSVENYLSSRLGFLIQEKFEMLIIRRKGELDIATHENPQQSDLISRVSDTAVWRIHNFVNSEFLIFKSANSVVLASAVLVMSRWWLFLIIFVGTLPELIVEVRYGRETYGIHAARAEVRRRYWDLRRHFDFLPLLSELKLFQTTAHFVAIIGELFRSFTRDEIDKERAQLKRQALTLTLSESVIAFASIWFVFDVIHGRLSIGIFTFLLYAISDLRNSLSSLFSTLGKFYQHSLFVGDVFQLVELEPAIKVRTNPIVLDGHRTPEIVFDNVSFSYPGSDKQVLKNFSVTIPPGRNYAFIGRNGAGKTTLLKLLCRFYDPNSGRILIGGNDLREIDLESWYSIIGVLFQDYAHYHFPAKDAIAIGRRNEELSLESVISAAKESESDGFIKQWTDSYDQMLGKEFTGGIEPSTGQWQKLAFARIFYRSPRVMILDEPTSSIDSESETKILKKLETFADDRTVILVSHRLSTVRWTDQIILIDEGRIVEEGSHEELLKLNGIYASMFAFQQEGYH
jgi:ATP-binding cassette subfamily B protein